MPLERAGVEDYDTLVELLTVYFQAAFPSYPPTDPQNMIQLMGAVLLQGNRRKAWELE